MEAIFVMVSLMAIAVGLLIYVSIATKQQTQHKA